VDNKEATKLKQQLEQVLQKLAQQEGNSLALTVGQLVTTTTRRNPVSRSDVNHVAIVNLSTLGHVSVHKGETAGLCIRLIFDGKLYAVCGDDAEQLKLWAEKASRANVRQRIDVPPKLVYHSVEGKVKIYNGELLAA